MRVLINGEGHELEAGASLEAAVASLPDALPDRGVAVALDGEVIPRSQWAATTVPEDARIELVVAVQGG